LAGTLRGIVSQRLLERADGRGRVPAAEVLVGTSKVIDCIADPIRIHDLERVLVDGQYHGMQTMQQSLVDLVRDGMISLSGYLSHLKAEVRPGFTIDEEFSAFNIYAEQMFKLPKGINLQLSGWYNSPAVSGTLKMESQGAVDLSLQKRILKDKGDVKLRFGDIFNTANWAATNLYTPGLEMTANGNWESRTVTLNFSYRFGRHDVKNSRQRRTGLEDESRRVKSSRN